MTAGDLYFAVFDLMPAEFADGVLRQVDGEAEVVESVDVPLWARRELGEFFDIGHRRDGQPVFAKFVKRKVVADTEFDVMRRDAVPDDVRGIARNVVKDRRVDPQIVDKGKKTDARTDAGSHDTDLFVALPF